MLIAKLKRGKLKFWFSNICTLKITHYIVFGIHGYPPRLSLQIQIILNFQRRSVIGLNFDFLTYNITGFLCYFIFNMGLYWIPVIQVSAPPSSPLSFLMSPIHPSASSSPHLSLPIPHPILSPFHATSWTDAASAGDLEEVY